MWVSKNKFEKLEAEVKYLRYKISHPEDVCNGVFCTGNTVLNGGLEERILKIEIFLELLKNYMNIEVKERADESYPKIVKKEEKCG